MSLELPADEALVLDAWLTRFDQTGDAQFEDQAEQRVLWDLAASLERQLGATFAPDYDARLRSARAATRDP